MLKNKSPWIAGILILAACGANAGEKRANLLPKLQSGQAFTYLIRYRSDKTVKTESRVVAPLAPNAAQVDARGLFRLEILDVRVEGSKTAVHARGQFLTLNSGVWLKKPGDKKPNWDVERIRPQGETINFTISPDGSIQKLEGLDSLFTDQQQAWKEWLARFALAWTFPPGGVRIGDKWRSEQPERADAPVAELHWLLESRYVRDEPCQPSQLSLTGEVSPSNTPPHTCAVILTAATLKQKSSSKDATPEDFKLHELKTMGTAKGSNEIITYISLQTGLVVRATEEANQFMDVAVVKADGSNRVHYNVNAKSDSEVLLVTETPLTRP